MPPLVALHDIVKTFPGVRANDGVTFTLERGEIHGLLGENGAGKTTLMSVLFGLYQPESGVIERDGVPVRIASPADAHRHHLAIVQQHFALVPGLRVSDNVLLGVPGVRLPRRPGVRAEVREVCERYGLDIDPDAVVGTLSIGQQQRVEILKCLYRNAEVIVLDEPTTVLTPNEADALFGVLRGLAAEGKGVIVITHKLDELVAHTDRITVLRAGRTVSTVNTSEASPQSLARAMVGRDVRLRSVAAFIGLDTPHDAAVACGPAETSTPSSPRKVRLLARDLRVVDVQGVVRLDSVSFDVAEGEVLGVAGVEGNGQRELVELLCGTRRATSGELVVDGTPVALGSPKATARAGVRTITEDRHATGLVLDMSVAENLVLDRFTRAPFARRGRLAHRAIEEEGRAAMAEFAIKAPAPGTTVRVLSGGNQQRVVLARELRDDLRVLVAAQPTRGLDVGAVEDVTDRVRAVRDRGAAVVLVSSDLQEILSLSDRVGVLVRGRLVHVSPVDEVDIARLGELMAGIGEVAAR